MTGALWVFVVGALVAVVVQSAAAGLPWQQRVGLAYPAYLVWALWSVGFLLGIKRRARTLALLARIAYRLRCWRVVTVRRRRLRAAAAAPQVQA